MDPVRLRTFPEVLDDWAAKAPDRRAYLYLGDGEREESSLTFAELRNAVLAAAERIATIARPGERAILFYPAGLDFVVAFLGCFCAGVVAVPVSLPNRKRGMEIIRGIAVDSGAKCILSVDELLRRYEEDFSNGPALADVPRFDTSGWSGSGSTPAPIDVRPESLALLQYTSGSTGSPRGVAVTHANLAANHRELQSCFQHDEHTVVVSWLPMFHDMGLGTALQALWAGGECVLMSPSAFLQKPARWLQAISRYRATFSGAPDFAFDLCARRVSDEERAGLDLSCWRGAYNGSEPVRATSLQRFDEVFRDYGFRWGHFHALYGLAEATLFVTGEDLSRGPTIQRFSRADLARGEASPTDSAEGHALVSCGHTWQSGQLVVVDPETLVECPPGRIGEIWLGGPSIAAGYWGREDATLETFQAYTSAGQGPFLRTGDLGFVHGGGLFVTGRSKDVIIVRGRNHYPQDIEDTVSECHPSLEPQRCAAFSVETEDGESLVVAQEVKRTALRKLNAEEVFREIRRSVADQHGLYAAAIVLLRPLALPRTTSGKVRRRACRDGFLDQSLAQVASSGFADATSTQRQPSAPPAPASSSARLARWIREHSRDVPRAVPRRSGSAPESLSEFARQGLLGMQVGAEFGGLALRHGETARVLEQLGGVDLGASLFLGLNNYLGVGPILRHGQTSARQELLPRLATGQTLAGFALAEPGVDSRANAEASRAEPVNGSGWRLYGHKFVTGGTPGAGLVNVFVQHGERSGISGFVVDRDAQGAQRGTRVNEDGVLHDSLRLDGVFVKRGHQLGDEGQGEEIAFEAIRHSHLAIGAACLGGMKRCSELIFEHATQRQIGKAGLVAAPVTMTRLGRITAEVVALECLVRLLADLADGGRQVGSEAFTVCKLVGPEMLWQAVDDLVQLLGRRGLVETDQVRQLVDDARVLRGLEGPVEAGSAVLGASLLEADFEPLHRLATEVFGEVDLEAMLREITKALQAAARVTAGEPPASLHWVDARAGELATWVVLLGAVERKRLAASSADLQRAAAWVRSSFDSTLALTRNGPPAEVRVEAREAVQPDRATSASGHAVAPSNFDTARDHRPHDRAHQRDLRSWAVSWLAERLRVDASRIDPRRSFADHGVDSLAAVEFAKALADRVGVSLDETLLWNFPTIDALLEHLERAQPGHPQSSSSRAEPSQASTGSPPEPMTGIEEEIERLERELKKRS